MLGRLKQVQHERLSAPPPAHLSNVSKASEAEVILAEKITDNLTDIAKKLPPSAIAPVDGLRKAMGIAPLGGGPEPMEVEPITHNPTIVTDNSLLPPSNGNQVLSNLLPPTPSPIQSASLLSPTGQQSQNIGIVGANQPPIQIQIGMAHSQTPPSLLSATEPSGVTDLESELREFLESDPTLGHSPLHDDKTLEDILSES